MRQRIGVPVVGQRYDVTRMSLVCWAGQTMPSNEDTLGYNIADYFDPEGTYLGEDLFGIYPVVMEEDK